MATSNDGRRHVCIDRELLPEFKSYMNQSPRHKKKLAFIIELLMGGHRNPELYDKEEINSKCKGVTAMKLFKGQENDRIYCKEQTIAGGIFIIVAAYIHERKKTQKISQREITIIEKIAQYEYEIQKLQG